MAGIIEELWYGNIAPMDKFGISDVKMRRIENLMTNNAENIMKVLSESQKTMVEEYEKNINRYAAVCSAQAFCDGFRLGAKLISEALGDV